MELSSLMKNLSTHTDIPLSGSKIFKSICAKIDNIQTDFVWAEFNNCTFLIVTQFKKIGSLISLEKDNLVSVVGQRESSFDSKSLLGSGDLENQLAARYLAENLNIEKPLYLFSNLQNYDVETLNAIKDICLDVFII